MKKAFLLTLVLMLAIGVTASAQDLSVNLEGGYLFGNYEEDDLTATHNGIVLSADAVISGPFGAMLNYSSLESSDFEEDGEPLLFEEREQTTSRFDILATYALPVDAFKVKVGLGYTSTSIDQRTDYPELRFDVVAREESVEDEYWERDATVSGAMVAISGEYSPVDKLTLTGFAGFGVGLNVEGTVLAYDYWDGYYEAEIDDECNLTVLKAAAAYQVAENVAIEAGYEFDKYAFDGEDVEFTISGFFLGARASF